MFIDLPNPWAGSGSQDDHKTGCKSCINAGHVAVLVDHTIALMCSTEDHCEQHGNREDLHNAEADLQSNTEA